MDLSRIGGVIDTHLIVKKTVAVVGLGGGANLCRNLVRCGIDRLIAFDKDDIGAENICRQEYMADMIGMPKALAMQQEAKRINAEIKVEPHVQDLLKLSGEESDQIFGKADVLVFAVDNLPANARGNEIALRLGKPAVFAGLYPEGRAGEIVFWHPGLASCYRCLCEARYEAHAQGKIQPQPSTGADIVSVQLLDSITAMVIIALLTHGSNNRFGKLIEQLGDRNFLQVKIDPTWNFAGVDPVAKYLEIPPGNDGYIGFCTVARRNPDRGMNCPDCTKYRSNTASVAKPSGE